MIRIDISPAMTLAYCTATGCHWRREVGSRSQGYSEGAVHQRRCHPSDVRAARTADELARRNR